GVSDVCSSDLVLSDSSILLPPIRTMDSSALEYPCGGLLTQFLPADPHPSYQGGEYSAPFHAHLLPAIPDEGSLPVFPICRHRLKSPYWQEPQRFLHSSDSALQCPCMPDQWFALFHCGRFCNRFWQLVAVLMATLHPFRPLYSDWQW